MGIHKSEFWISIPNVDLATYVFQSQTPEARKAPQFFDADCPSRNYSLEQAELYTRQLACGLQKWGLKEDEKLLLYSGNDLFFPVLLWGTTAAGCVFTGSSTAALPSELAYQLKNSDARVIIAAPDKVEPALKAAELAEIPKDNVFAFCNTKEDDLAIQGSGVKSWRTLWASEEEGSRWSWKPIKTEEEAKSKTAVINYSSGTTGLPKGVEISHYNLVANNEQAVQRETYMEDSEKGRARVARLQESGHRWIAAIPMFHAFGQTYFCQLAPVVGAKVYIMKVFNLEKWLLYNDIYRITHLVAVPTMMGMLAKYPRAPLFNLHSIENNTCGSAPLAKDVRDKVQSLMRPGSVVKQGWGMTETTTGATNWLPDEETDGTSVGKLGPNNYGKLRTVEGRDFKEINVPYEIGEILIAGPSVMKGYYKNKKATDDTISYEDGLRWVATGDIGYFDDKEEVYIVDRIKDLIKVKGLQVAPAEIEQCLMAHTEIADAGVVGHKVNGNEYPKAFVVRKNQNLTAEEVQNFVKEHLSKHKWLEGGVEFIPELPRNPSGKILRRKLMERPSGQPKL